jgi:hypothetical protein
VAPLPCRARPCLLASCLTYASVFVSFCVLQVWGVPSCAGSPYIIDKATSASLETQLDSALAFMSNSPCAAEIVLTKVATYSVPSARVLPAGSSLTIDATQVTPCSLLSSCAAKP